MLIGCLGGFCQWSALPGKETYFLAKRRKSLPWLSALASDRATVKLNNLGALSTVCGHRYLW